MPPAEKIVLLHGFTQCGAVWADIAAELTRQGYDVSTPDLPGHGTDASHDTASLVEAAHLIADAHGEAVYVGYSLGARVALHVALERPGVVNKLVLVGVRLGFTGAEADERRRDDEALARRIETVPMDDFVDDWLSLPFNARIPAIRGFRDLRVARRPEGLAASLRHAGTGTRAVSPETLRTAPLVVIGEHDFDGVIADAHRIITAVPTSRLHVIPGIGHGVPFELEPAEFAKIVSELLSSRPDLRV